MVAAPGKGRRLGETAGIVSRDGARREAALGLTRGEVAVALLGVALTSLAFLGFQIAASRLLSVLLSYHFVFALVSLAMLGLGFGGVAARLAFPRASSRRDSLRIAAGATACAALGVLVALAVALRVADRPWIGETSGMFLVLGLLLVPLLLAGVALAQLFRAFGRISGQIYGADLAGAAVGCLGVIWALDQLGGVGTLLGAALLAAAGALALAWPARKSGGPLGGTAVVLAVLGLVFLAFLSGTYNPRVPVGANPEKEIHDALAGPGGGEVEAARWSSFGRTDLISFGERRGYKDLYIDGTAGSPMYRFSGDFDAPGEAVGELIEGFPGWFPFLFMAEPAREQALVIGPGGGRDVLLARMAGFAHVRAVEVNPDLVALVREQAAYNGDLFGRRDDIEVVVDEGRSFVRRDDERYGLVMLSLPVTNTSRSPEGFALTESFLLTAEAILDYLDTLAPDGELVIVAHDEAAILRLVATAIDALEARGLTAREVMARTYLLGSFPYPVFVLRQGPIGEAEAEAMLAEARERGYSLVASFFPGIGAPGAVSPVLQALEQGRIAPADLVQLARERGVDIASVRDERPFFHHFEIAPPRAVVAVAAIAAGLTLAVLLASLVGGGARAAAARLLHPVLYILLGVGFMLIEISLIQRFMLFLGQPVHVLAVVLFVLLLAMSAGSLASSRLAAARIAPALAVAGLAAAALLGLLTLLLPPLLEALLGLSLAARILVTALLLAPLGFVLGMPFPLGIRALALAGEHDRIPWMWALNGTASVLGAAAAVLGAMTFGLSAVLGAGLVCYLGVAALGLLLRPAQRNQAGSSGSG